MGLAGPGSQGNHVQPQPTKHIVHPHQVHGVHASPCCVCWALRAWSNYSPGLLALVDAFQLIIERSAPSFKFFSSPCSTSCFEKIGHDLIQRECMGKSISQKSRTNENMSNRGWTLGIKPYTMIKVRSRKERVLTSQGSRGKWHLWSHSPGFLTLKLVFSQLILRLSNDTLSWRKCLEF